MPVYSVTTEMGRLDQDQKEKIAAGITAIHGEETGAPEPLIHVIFMAYPKGAAWSSSKPGAPNIVNASIRAGRPESVRQKMLFRINELMCGVMGIQSRDLLVALFDFPPHWATEGGMILPPTQPEPEAAWEAEFYKRFPPEQHV